MTQKKRTKIGQFFLQDRFCHASVDLWLQNPSPKFNRLMLSTQGLLPIEIQKRYLNLVNNAVFAEVNNWPPVTAVEGAEAAQLDSVLEIT